MPTQVIVLNGGSSAGKTTLARHLQNMLPDPWLALSTDVLIDLLPASITTQADGIRFDPDGAVHVGPAFARLEKAWMTGIAAMAHAGAGVLLDEVFLSGAASQQRLQRIFAGLSVLWVGVRCDSAVAAGREAARGDRTPGMAALQAEAAHRGVAYDLEVDTTSTGPLDCARLIAAHVANS